MDARLLELSREEPRYSYEAYEFVCESVIFTQTQLGREPKANETEGSNHHVSGAELVRGACELARREFGMMAPLVFRFWGIRTTDDFGRIVFNLIRIDRLSRSDDDDPDDFHDLFDLNRALSEDFEIPAAELPRKAGGR